MRKYFLCLALTLSLSGLVNGAELLGLYEFEGNANDSSTAGNHATSIDVGVEYEPGFNDVGQAASFFGGDSGIGVVVPIDITPTAHSSVTIGGWVLAFGGGAWGNHDGAYDRGLISGGANSWHIYNNVNTDSSIPSVTEEWQFVAVTYKVDPNERGHSASLTVNDGVVYSNAGDPNQTSAQTSLAIGSIDPSGTLLPFDGLIDSLFVYDDALSAKQIESIRLGGPSAVPQTLTETLDPRATQMTWDFESGDLSNWNIVTAGVPGTANVFDYQPVDAANSAGGEGDFYIHTYRTEGNGIDTEGEVPNSDTYTGVIETDPFVLGPNARFDFLIAGGREVFTGDPDAAVLDEANGVTLEQEVSPGDWEVIFTSSSSRKNSFWASFWDAGLYEGETVRLRIYDTRDGAWGTTAVDSIVYSITDPNAVEENADFDGDGDVDGSDFLAWQTGFGSGSTLAQGDANGDGNVDAADFSIWESQFGNISGGGSLAGAAVPEPGTLALLVLMALATSAWGWKRR